MDELPEDLKKTCTAEEKEDRGKDVALKEDAPRIQPIKINKPKQTVRKPTDLDRVSSYCTTTTI